MNSEEDSNMNVPNKDKELEENIINNKYNNYIIAEINIEKYKKKKNKKNKKNNINKKIILINSFEQTIKEKGQDYFEDIKKEEYYKYENEKEIKDNCLIEIINNKIEFSYFHEFKEEGKYIIKYIFLNNITKTDFMFYNCESLTNLNLSNFNTQNVINMSSMFYYCNSLLNNIYKIK